MSKDWIEKMNGGKGPKKGALHKELGVPEGKEIPEGKLKESAEKGGILGKRARLAETLKKMKK